MTFISLGNGVRMEMRSALFLAFGCFPGSLPIPIDGLIKLPKPKKHAQYYFPAFITL